MSLLKDQTALITLRPFFRFLLPASFFLAVIPVLAQHPLDFAAGKAIFDKNWVFAPASTGASDGLGPFFNARSCNACHPDGDRGANSTALVVHLNDLAYGQQIQKFTRPGVPAEALIDLNWPDNADTKPLLPVAVSLLDLEYGPLTSPALSLRIAPPVHGLGLLESIPESVILLLADAEDADGDGISGRVNRLPDGKLGRFGWKASQASLFDQIGRALSLDMGLGNPHLPDPHGDCTLPQADCRKTTEGNNADNLEVSQEVFDLLVSYVRKIPAPPQVNLTAGERVGQNLFLDTGCGGCHLPKIEFDGQEIHPYTDLLLHDMGPGLADELEEGGAAGNEWRTPPLWGLKPSHGNFLHDGRARNLREAILWHGGEANAARQAFQELNEKEQSDLIDFLSRL